MPDPAARARLADEVADVLITTLMLADQVHLDPADAMLTNWDAKRM